jgi:hypothetical protein
MGWSFRLSAHVLARCPRCRVNELPRIRSSVTSIRDFPNLRPVFLSSDYLTSLVMSRDSPVVRDVSPDEGYTYMHRAFLQGFMTRNVMTVDVVKPLLAAAMSAHSKLRMITSPISGK